MLTLIRFLYAHTARCTHGWRQPQIPCGFHSSGTTGDPPDGAAIQRGSAQRRGPGCGKWQDERQQCPAGGRQAASETKNPTGRNSAGARRRDNIERLDDNESSPTGKFAAQSARRSVRGFAAIVHEYGKSVVESPQPFPQRGIIAKPTELGWHPLPRCEAASAPHEQSAGSGSCVHRRFGRSTDGFGRKHSDHSWRQLRTIDPGAAGFRTSPADTRGTTEPGAGSTTPGSHARGSEPLEHLVQQQQ